MTDWSRVNQCSGNQPPVESLVRSGYYILLETLKRCLLVFPALRFSKLVLKLIFRGLANTPLKVLF